MASRPVFVPQYCGTQLVEERIFEIDWSPGFSPTQKKKNIVALHQEAKRHGIERILEISTKSNSKIGQRLSAFSLKLEIKSMQYSLESVYQGCKVFDHSGPFTHLFELTPRDVRRYIHSTDRGKLTGYKFLGKDYPLSPKNAFYDWLYIRSLMQHTDWIRQKVLYDAFTDIEFNSKKQINCQTRAFAEYLSLLKRKTLTDAVDDFDCFSQMLNPF